MKSINQVANAHGVEARTVRNWLSAARKEGKDLGRMLGNKRMFTADEVVALASYGRQSDAPEVVVESGNHCTAIDVPAFDGMTIDLGQFRDSSSMVVNDPLAAAEQFLHTADLIQGALADDIAARELRLARTKQAQAKVEAKSRELALEQRLYRMQTAQIDQAQTEKTTALANAMAKMQSLGKPQGESPNDGLN